MLSFTTFILVLNLGQESQNLLVSYWIVDHRLLKESLELLNFLSLWKEDQILSQNIVYFWSVKVTAFKLTLSHADIRLMSPSMVKLFPHWSFFSSWFYFNGRVQIVTFQLGMEIDGHSCLNVEWPSKYYYCQNLVSPLVKCQGIRDFMSLSSKKN